MFFQWISRSILCNEVYVEIIAQQSALALCSFRHFRTALLIFFFFRIFWQFILWYFVTWEFILIAWSISFEKFRRCRSLKLFFVISEFLSCQFNSEGIFFVAYFFFTVLGKSRDFFDGKWKILWKESSGLHNVRLIFLPRSKRLKKWARDGATGGAKTFAARKSWKIIGVSFGFVWDEISCRWTFGFFLCSLHPAVFWERIIFLVSGKMTRSRALARFRFSFGETCPAMFTSIYMLEGSSSLSYASAPFFSHSSQFLSPPPLPPSTLFPFTRLLPQLGTIWETITFFVRFLQGVLVARGTLKLIEIFDFSFLVSFRNFWDFGKNLYFDNIFFLIFFFKSLSIGWKKCTKLIRAWVPSRNFTRSEKKVKIKIQRGTE